MQATVSPQMGAVAICAKTALEPLPMGSSYTVRRERMVRDLVARGREAGIVVVCAPNGFGKTATLMQYADEIRSDPSRGVVQMIEATDSSADELLVQLEEVENETSEAMRPLVAIDNVPCYKPEEREQLVARLRGMRSHGYEILLTCTPANMDLMHKLSDSVKVHAQALRVHPREYSDWARVFTISRTLDVYGLTQGVPELVAALQTTVGSPQGDADLLQAAIVNVTGSIVAELIRSESPLLRPVCLMLLVGDGNITELERVGLRISADALSSISRDYPIFGFDPATLEFSCLGTEQSARRRIREIVAAAFPSLVMRAIRVHMKAGRIDLGIALAERYLDSDGAFELVQQFPVTIPLAGHADFVSKTLQARESKYGSSDAGVAACLSAYVSACTMGNYRLARAMAQVLSQRADEIEQELHPEDWTSALAVSEVWASCKGIALPQLSEGFCARMNEQCKNLRAHAEAIRNVVNGTVCEKLDKCVQDASDNANVIDVPSFFTFCDNMLYEIMTGSFNSVNEDDEILASFDVVLRERKLAPLLDLQRMVLNFRRLMACMPLLDERAFNEASTGAIRASDQDMQLFCMLLEGWQDLERGKIVNAQFRGQQVQKLAGTSRAFLQDWAYLLEIAAHLRNSSRIAVREDAELLDLMAKDLSPAITWAYALQLSAAHFDAELAAWYSLHKEVLLGQRFRLFARLAMRIMGERADAVRRLLPARAALSYAPNVAVETRPVNLFDMPRDEQESELGQVVVTLFGGFKIARNGHVLTSTVWRRKRSSVLVARLALEMGSMVSRQILGEEFWPNAGENRARDNLYVTISVLKKAIGQVPGGPEYIISQGDCVAVNKEFISSDVAQFDRMAREILTRKLGTTCGQVIDMCLKMEELYVGPLYVPSSGRTAYFERMRKSYASKFIDCMIKGATVAMEDGDMPSASWLIEAALRHGPAREDVLRCAMRVYDMEGRRREVVDLYNGHLHYLEHELRTIPEAETRELYEQIVHRARLRGVV